MKDLWSKTQYQRKEEHTVEDFVEREYGLNLKIVCIPYFCDKGDVATLGLRLSL
jgi:hypothetical protein